MIDKYAKREIPNAIWSIKDVMVVTLCVIVGGLLFYFTTLVLFDDSKTTFRLARYVGSLLMIFVPLFWVNKKYGLSKEVLGLRKGNLNLLSHVLIGVIAAFIYFFLLQLTPFRYGAAPIDLKLSYSSVNLILLPFSISGFATTVLTPVSEEIMIRGFIYGYLRKKQGVFFGLFLQAVLFSLLHYNVYGNALNAVVQTFIIGLILGLLYEKTESLYPSMICHGVINYLSIIAFVLYK